MNLSGFAASELPSFCMEVRLATQCSMGRVHPQLGTMTSCETGGGHAGPEGRVASEDSAVHRVAQVGGCKRCMLVTTDQKWWWWLVRHGLWGIQAHREMVRGWALRVHHRWWYKNIRWGGCELMYMQRHHSWDGITL